MKNDNPYGGISAKEAAENARQAFSQLPAFRAPLIIFDEATNTDPKIFKKLDRQFERSKYIGKNNLLGRLLYRWAKRRGRVQGELYFKPGSSRQIVIDPRPDIDIKIPRRWQ